MVLYMHFISGVPMPDMGDGKSESVRDVWVGVAKFILFGAGAIWVLFLIWRGKPNPADIEPGAIP